LWFILGPKTVSSGGHIFQGFSEWLQSLFWFHLGFILAPSWPLLGSSGAQLGLSWTYLDFNLAYGRGRCLQRLGRCLGRCSRPRHGVSMNGQGAQGRASLRPPAMLYQLMDFEEGEGGGSPDVSVSLVSLSMGMGWAGTSICFPRKPRISFMLMPQQFLLKSQLLSTNDVVPYMHDRID
jgi:hypothetical protein